jgi:hypothetical protein
MLQDKERQPIDRMSVFTFHGWTLFLRRVCVPPPQQQQQQQRRNEVTEFIFALFEW